MIKIKNKLKKFQLIIFVRETVFVCLKKNIRIYMRLENSETYSVLIKIFSVFLLLQII